MVVSDPNKPGKYDFSRGGGDGGRPVWDVRASDSSLASPARVRDEWPEVSLVSLCVRFPENDVCCFSAPGCLGMPGPPIFNVFVEARDEHCAALGGLVVDKRNCGLNYMCGFSRRQVL